MLFQELIKKDIYTLCNQHDLSNLGDHIQEVMKTGQSTSKIYRLRVSATQDKYISVQTKSKLFKANGNGQEPEFIMATHSIIGYVNCDIFFAWGLIII
jgi:hypothetical protein